jgi:elongation factor Tu
MDTVDDYIKQPERPINAPFLLSVEGTLMVKGRGTVVTGKVDQGKVTIMMNWKLLVQILEIPFV